MPDRIGLNDVESGEGRLAVPPRTLAPGDAEHRRTFRTSMPAPTARSGRSRTAQLLSTALFIVAIGFAVAAVWIWYTDDSREGPGTPPPAQNAEEIDLAQVLGVLKTSDESWDYSRSPSGARSNQLDMPGQALKLDDERLLFVFIFTGASSEDRIAAREQAAQGVDLDTMTLTTTSGKVLNADGQPLSMAQHSNVIAILLGGDDALAEEVQGALDRLP
jgi:hypothetical protein